MIDKAYFDRLSPWDGEKSFSVSIPPIRVDFENLDPGIYKGLEKRYSHFEGTGGNYIFSVSLYEDSRKYYIIPEKGGRSERYRMETLLEDNDFTMWSFSFAGWFNIREKKGKIALAASEVEPRDRSFENYLRVLCAWMAIDLNGFFIHGASILRKGQVHIFFGPSSAGKSTLAELSREGSVISDDLTLVIPSGDALVALGSPFRGTYDQGEIIQGEFPVAGLYRIVKDDKDYIETKSPNIIFSEVIANIPFVVDKLGQRKEIFELIRSNLKKVPCYYLHFSKKGDFWKVIESLR
jgi:hypothetical protein